MRNSSLFITAVLLCMVSCSHARPQATKQPVVSPVTAAALKKAIAARKGRVVLVNFWATWCVPCVQEMPGLVKLQKQYAGKGLSLLLVSADEQKTKNSKVVPFLA